VDSPVFLLGFPGQIPCNYTLTRSKVLFAFDQAVEEIAAATKNWW
jgi:hypothetical protein